MKKGVETYRVDLFCSNCGTRQKVHIPKGTTRKEWMGTKIIRCDYCGCEFKWDS